MDEILKDLVNKARKFLTILENKTNKQMELFYWVGETPSDDILNNLISIEKKSFSQNLRYNIEEFRNFFNKKNPLLFLITEKTEKKQPIAFILCYEDPDDETAYYVDAGATLITKARLMKLMMVIIYIWGFIKGYKSLRLRTEENDYHGNPLLEMYKGQGFVEYSRNVEGIYIGHEITEARVESLKIEFLQNL